MRVLAEVYSSAHEAAVVETKIFCQCAGFDIDPEKSELSGYCVSSNWPKLLQPTPLLPMSFLKQYRPEINLPVLIREWLMPVVEGMSDVWACLPAERQRFAAGMEASVGEVEAATAVGNGIGEIDELDIVRVSVDSPERKKAGRPKDPHVTKRDDEWLSRWEAGKYETLAEFAKAVGEEPDAVRKGLNRARQRRKSQERKP